MLCLARRFSEPGALARWAGVALLVAAASLGRITPAHAFDLFAAHRVTAQFATASGQPMADAKVRVFAPGDLKTPVATGRTDSQGKFEFGADRDGMWMAEARTPTEVARVMIRVGPGGPGQQQQSRLPPYILIGGLMVLLALAWWYRIVRGRGRRRP
jgi:hypothetical protein